MTTIYVACVIVMWLAGANATHYDLYRDMIYDITVVEEQTEICDLDEVGKTTAIYVVGLNDEEESEPSDTLLLERRWNFDCVLGEHDGRVGLADFGEFVTAFNTSNGGLCDFSIEGIVGLYEYGQFIQEFGTCNDGTIMIDCGDL